MFRVSQVNTNGGYDRLDTADENQARSLFEALTKADDVLYVALLELGFAGTSDAQWVVLNESAKYAAAI